MMRPTMIPRKAKPTALRSLGDLVLSAAITHFRLRINRKPQYNALFPANNFATLLGS